MSGYANQRFTIRRIMNSGAIRQVLLTLVITRIFQAMMNLNVLLRKDRVHGTINGRWLIQFTRGDVAWLWLNQRLGEEPYEVIMVGLIQARYVRMTFIVANIRSLIRSHHLMYDDPSIGVAITLRSFRRHRFNEFRCLISRIGRAIIRLVIKACCRHLVIGPSFAFSHVTCVGQGHGNAIVRQERAWDALFGLFHRVISTISASSAIMGRLCRIFTKRQDRILSFFVRVDLRDLINQDGTYVIAVRFWW